MVQEMEKNRDRETLDYKEDHKIVGAHGERTNI
jgi:hypothetical protein